MQGRYVQIKVKGRIKYSKYLSFLQTVLGEPFTRILLSVFAVDICDNSILCLDIFFEVFFILGCVFEDTELVGGDLPKRRGGGGVKANNDDDCAFKCENNNGCK